MDFKTALGLLIAGILTSVIAFCTSYYFAHHSFPWKHSDSFNTQTSPDNTPENPPPQGAIAKVGDEYIYQQDLEAEVAHQQTGQVLSAESRQNLLGKLVYDSTILQGAAADSLVSLNNTIFNNAQKDYLQRVKTVEEVKRHFATKLTGLHGIVVYIWFDQQNSPLTEEQRKEVARKTLQTLRDEVVTNKITIAQAAEKLKQDMTLAQVTKDHKNSTSMEFHVLPEEKITFFTPFDTLLKSLKPGEVTEIFLAKDTDYSGNSVKEKTGRDVAYLFGQVTDVITEGNIIDFSHWYEKKLTSYEITYY